MTKDIPEVRRRGRPPVKEAAPVVAKTEPETDGKPAKRRRRASVGGHAMKLTAPSREGYSRRWFNDINNRIADADSLAYDFVCEPGTKSTDVGSRVSRLVGTKPNGEPLRAYLMETPDELYAEGMAEKQAYNQRIDEAISAGLPTDQAVGLTPGEGSIKQGR